MKTGTFLERNEMNEDQLQEIAAQLACPDGDDGITIAEKMNDTNALLTERSIERLSPIIGERIVEVGPGNGVLSIPIIETIGTGGHYIGLERSEVMAQQAREQLGRHARTSVDIHSGDCMAAPIGMGSIDGLMAVNVLYFIDDLSAFFTRIHEWLKPGGRAVFGLRSAQSLEGMPFTRYGFHIRSLKEVTECLKSCGFGDVDSKYFDDGMSKLGDLEIPVDSLIIRAITK